MKGCAAAVTQATSTGSQSFPYPFFFPRLKKYLRTHKNTETDSKRYSIQNRSVCGAVILPQRCAKNREEDLEHMQ